ncbi:hypothetical protein L6164_006696 [Bauhinia variegata]|uniref:Uncharacterized protein n=1 Tax=Bauhinia variegata TaxID=167791 RepID=A0ACB9PVA6_BAUVA|nr:hypothetical protein L6164_006696 [Bauhinia variegata]
MSAKVMKSMKEENPELQKQIGCIHGFFQLFDRHRYLTGQRNSSLSQNSVTPTGRKSNHNRELNSITQKATVKNHKASGEKQQFSTESSRTSVSSSSLSSSMSSLEFSRTVQIEAPSITQTRFPESPIAVMKQFDIRSQQSLGLRDIVRDSIHREAQGLSVKTLARKEKGHGLKHIDSPRPSHSPKCVNNGVITRNESFSLHALSRSQKRAWDSPRLSYDGRDTQDSFKYSMKHKELPRLSLDSRERSMRGLNEGTKSRKGQQRGYGSCSTSLDQPQEPETSKRSSSVVAKLMGLEALPDQAQTCESPYRTITCSLVKKESSARSTQESNPSLSVYGEIEKRLKELEFKKSGKDLRALKQILEAMQRYKDSLDLKGDQASNSSSDTRNDSGLSESSIVQSPRNVQKKGPISQGDKSQIVIMKPAKAARKTKNPTSTDPFIPGKPGLSMLHPGSPPAGRLLDKQTVNCSANKSNKTNSKLRVSQDINGERFASSSSNTSGTDSPRLQQKRFGVERRSRPTSPSSESNSYRGQHNSQSIESSSPSTTSRLKSSTSQKGIGRLSKPNGHRKNSRKNVDVISPDFDRQNFTDSQVIHINDSDKNTSFRMHDLNQNNGTKEMGDNIPMVETTLVMSEQPSPVSVLDTAFYRDDPPSPVKKRIYSSKNSDEALNIDERDENSAGFPHLANTTNAQFSNEANDRDLNTKHLIQMLGHIDCPHEEPINLNGTHWHMKDPDHKYIAKILLASGLLGGTCSSQTIHSPGHPINPRLFLALEQIKTTKGVSGIEDSAKLMVKTSNPQKMRRKLIFDVVNDVLVQKLALETSSSQWFQPNKLTGRKPEGQQLLNEICSEIDQLQRNDKNASLADEDMNLTRLLQGDPILHPTIWTECYSEIPDTVLDIERLIFKDLITETVRDEAANHRGRHCRKQLFS